MIGTKARRLDAVKGQLSSGLLINDSLKSKNQTSKNNSSPSDVSGDLEGERIVAAFDVDQMTNFVYGGKSVVKLRSKMLMEFERDPTFRLDDAYDLTKAQQRERVMTRLRSLIGWVESESSKDFELRLQLLILIDPGFLTRIAVHYGLFLNTILTQGTPEQANYWVAQGAQNLDGLIGCYGMTELGHGSNVAGLETTATFDREIDEFVIHTPSLTGTKWWIGGAAESATHSTVFANLIVDGKSYGVKPFVVPLRDPKTFKLLHGVRIGDCGAKMGRNAIDNGWMQFTGVRVPRINMLMRYTTIDRDGIVQEPPSAQLAYGALIYGRTSIVRESGECCRKAITIAIRYACVRRQFGNKDGREIRIMDYTTHQHRLIPLIGTAYAVGFVAMELQSTYDLIISRLTNTGPNDPQIVEILAELKEIHATSAGMKAMCTWNTLDLIEQCRQSLGGLGYSSYAGLASMFQDFAVQCSWEGDNTILSLQTGRFLISAVRARLGSKGVTAPKLAPKQKSSSYLDKIPELLKTSLNENPNFEDLNTIQMAFDATAANLAIAAFQAFEKEIKVNKLTPEDAQLQCGAQKLIAARVHCATYAFSAFRRAVIASGTLENVLGDLCSLYGLYAIKQNASAFVQFQIITPKHLGNIDDTISRLLTKLRPQVVPLTDAFALTDYSLNSPLACADGDIYRRFFERVNLSAPYTEEHPYFEKVIKPVLLRNK